MTTLEEVFLRVANGTADVESRKEIAGISMMRQSSYSSTMMEAATTKVIFFFAVFLTLCESCTCVCLAGSGKLAAPPGHVLAAHCTLFF